MVQLSLIVFGLVVSTVRGVPLNKRIAQTISAATAKWEKACIAAGGGDQCNPVSVAAFSTLLAAAGPCEQQDAADQMIDLAKQLGNDEEMIRLTQIFVQQPRNTPTSQSVPYCQQAPKNEELDGLFQCQFQGANPKVFVGGLSVGQSGTIPFGQNAPVNPPGSCPARPSPVADGTQLVDIVQDPGVGGSSGGNAGNIPSTPPEGGSGGGAANDAPSTPPKATTAASAPRPSNPGNSTPATPNGNAGDFQLKNGQDAQALNAKFSTLNAQSSCTSGENACVNGNSFAQCVDGKFVTTKCASSLSCFALPLVKSPGTSIACTTEDDAAARIAASGATGGIAGSGDTSTPAPSAAPPKNPKPSSGQALVSNGGGFKLQNGKDAQALNAKFSSLTENSPCNPNETACIGKDFAQCVNGKFVVTSCGASLTCAALPLVNKPGTSITCTTTADAAARIEATGATGGITGV